MSYMQQLLLPFVGSLCLAASASAQVEYATSVVSFNQGGGSGIFDQSLILGGPRGGAGSHVLTLGTGGDVTLAFDVTLTDGPGADFIVYENGFEFGGLTFPEMAMVEVSSNGVDFARFPMRYDGPQGPFMSNFELLPWGVYSGLTGLVPPVANVDTNTIDPLNPVLAGGEALDLADLHSHPLVQMGLVDLQAVEFIRLVDLIAGNEVDTRFVTIWDSGGVDGNADIDAVAVINHTGNQNVHAPTIDLWRDTIGYIWLEISDPNGFSDINLGTLQLSVNLQALSFSRLRDYFVLDHSGPQGLVLRTPLPVILEDFQAVLAVSVEDSSGLFSTDQISLNR